MTKHRTARQKFQQVAVELTGRAFRTVPSRDKLHVRPAGHRADESMDEIQDFLQATSKAFTLQGVTHRQKGHWKTGQKVFLRIMQCE